MSFVKTESDRSVKSVSGKLYFYRGAVLLMIVARNTESEKAANRYLADGIIDYQGVVL